MRITMLAAGAGGMYCGSCMRDNALADALRRAGHEVHLLALYTPLRTDRPAADEGAVFYGGINVFLQQVSLLFRRTPRAVDWLLDRPALLRLAMRLGTSATPERLGELTVSILAGRHGRQRKELDRLLGFLAAQPRPDAVVLPNAMFLGLARPLREALGCPVVCELTGEDLFLEALPEAHRREALALIASAGEAVERFIATARWYADYAAAQLALPAGRIEVVYPGIPLDDLEPPPPRAAAAGTVGYLARICPEKGFPEAVHAVGRLRGMPGLGHARLLCGGYLPPNRRAWFDALQTRARTDGWADGFEHRGEVDRAGKLALLQEADVLCVPAAWPEAKGLYALEALACGRPFVGFDHGSLAELAELTGGGVVVPPGDVAALADALAALLRDPDRRRAMGAAGRLAVRDRFSDEAMARQVLACLGRGQPA